MEKSQFNTDDLFKYYKNQVYKMLGLFENKDLNGHKHAIRVRSEMDELPEQFSKLYDDYRYNIVIAKIDVLIKELFFLDGEHQFVKNHVMESLNLLEDIKEGLK